MSWWIISYLTGYVVTVGFMISMIALNSETGQIAWRDIAVPFVVGFIWPIGWVVVIVMRLIS